MAIEMLPDSRLHAMRALLTKDEQERARVSMWQRVREWFTNRRQLWPTRG